MSARIGDLLVKEGVITAAQLQQALEAQKKGGGRLGSVLVKLNFLSEEEVTTFLSRQYGVPSINLSYFDLDPTIAKLIPEDTARRYEVLPLSRVGSSLTIAMTDPTNVFAMDDIKFMTGFNIEPVVASEQAIQDALKPHNLAVGSGYGSFKDSQIRIANFPQHSKEDVRRVIETFDSILKP